jgi:hypothetical protein
MGGNQARVMLWPLLGSGAVSTALVQSAGTWKRVDDVHRQGMSRRGLRQRPTSGPETWIKAMRERSFWWCWSSAARTSFLDSG